jgi:hypothetical protein
MVVVFLLVQFAMVFSIEKRLLSWEPEIQLVRKHITYLNFVKVTMLVRSEKFRASKIMEARVRKTENITILMNHDTVEVLGDEQVVTGVKALNKTTNEEFEIPVTGFFVAIGHKPNTDKDFLSLDETGYIINVVGLQNKYSRCFVSEMLQTMSIVKQLPLQVRDVWQHLMQRDI